MRFTIASIVVFVSGLSFWLFSLQLFGHREPFDGHLGKLLILMTGVSLFAMVIAGIKYTNRFWIWSLLGVLGQICGEIVTVGASPLMVVGIIFLIILSLPGLLLCALAILPMRAISRVITRNSNF